MLNRAFMVSAAVALTAAVYSAPASAISYFATYTEDPVNGAVIDLYYDGVAGVQMQGYSDGEVAIDLYGYGHDTSDGVRLSK